MNKCDLSKKRLEWQCRRGMLELDVLLGRYLNEQYSTLNDAGKKQFKALLGVEDPDLYAYLMQQTEVPAEFQERVDAIRQWVK